MPVVKELRRRDAAYGQHWEDVVRPLIYARAGNKCEQCAKPRYAQIRTVTGYRVVLSADSRIVRMQAMFWVRDGCQDWRDHLGALDPRITLPALRASKDPTDSGLVLGEVRLIRRVQLSICHLNNVPGDDRDENLRCYCNWCHLNHDKDHHKLTRMLRGDRQRPFLVATGAVRALLEGGAFGELSNGQEMPDAGAHAAQDASAGAWPASGPEPAP